MPGSGALPRLRCSRHQRHPKNKPKRRGAAWFSLLKKRCRVELYCLIRAYICICMYLCVYVVYMYVRRCGDARYYILARASSAIAASGALPMYAPSPRALEEEEEEMQG